jgi:hypothetical protein
MEKFAYSIKEFCFQHDISRSKFYDLRKNGLTPKMMQVGRRRLISVEAAKEMYKVAILCVTHINKSEHRTSLNRMSGSIAFGALARFVFVVTKDQENPKRRLMLQAKNNLAEDAKVLAYSIKDIDGFPMVEWENEYVTVSADAAFSNENKQKTSEMNDAVSWLLELLSSGKMKSKEIAVLAQEEGFSVATVRRAKKKLGVIPIREEYGEEGSWWCELPKVLIYPIDAQP